MAALKAKGKLKEVPAWTEARPKPRNLGLGAEKMETKVTEQKVEERLESRDTEHVETKLVEAKKKKKSKKKKEADGEVEEVACAKMKKKKRKKDRQERLDFEAADIEKQEVVEEAEGVVLLKKKS